MRAFARRACIHCAAGSLRRGRSSEIEATGLGLAAEPERGLGELNPHAQTSRRQIAVNQPNRFARFSADGRLVALVADGPVPEWPADLAAVEDAQLRVLEEAYLAEFSRLEADPNADLADLRALAEHVAALRAAAAERMSSTEPSVDPANEPEPTPPVEGDPAPAPTEGD